MCAFLIAIEVFENQMDQGWTFGKKNKIFMFDTKKTAMKNVD